MTETYKWWRVMGVLPTGWHVNNHAPSPLSGCVFIANAKSPVKATEQALLRVRESKAMEVKP